MEAKKIQFEKKQVFEVPSSQIIIFSNEDIITSSGEGTLRDWGEWDDQQRENGEDLP